MLMQAAAIRRHSDTTLPVQAQYAQGTSQRIFLTSTGSLHFPHYWKLDTVICY